MKNLLKKINELFLIALVVLTISWISYLLMDSFRRILP